MIAEGEKDVKAENERDVKFRMNIRAFLSIEGGGRY
jgi:hypothetical protein